MVIKAAENGGKRCPSLLQKEVARDTNATVTMTEEL
jgi:hypothetical protein